MIRKGKGIVQNHEIYTDDKGRNISYGRTEEKDIADNRLLPFRV